MPRYQVLVDDNAHHQDVEYRKIDGTYDLLEDAFARCHDILDRFFAAEFRPGISADELYRRYMSFGEDPFIVVLDGSNKIAEFSAWDHAELRCRMLCNR